MDQSIYGAIAQSMALLPELAKLVEDCRRQGCDLPLHQFEIGCRTVAAGLDAGLDDESLDLHFGKLLRTGDRLAAVLLIIPSYCAYRLERNRDGDSRAVVWWDDERVEGDMQCDDEAAALLGALALAVRTNLRGPRAVPFSPSLEGRTLLGDRADTL